MTARRIKRTALNRGTAVHLGGARVRFIWPCGCKHVHTIKAHGMDLAHRELSPQSTAKLVEYWREVGVVLEQCKRHPEWYSKESQLKRLNQENPNDRSST
jgi:hypothetical protein